MAGDWALTVAELNEYVRRLLAGDPILSRLRVRGEISGFKRHVSGHLYFTLKDEDARVQCVMFRQHALSLAFSPKDGMKVTVGGSASLYAQGGAYQLYVTSMDQEGVGELYLRFEALKKRLEAEGLFDPSIKKPLPPYPKTIGIVTSKTGAALRDMIRVARRRNPRVHILLCPATVQGESAAGEIAQAIKRLNREGSAEVLLVGRGGGSMEDLWPFNEEIVARAIAGSDIPVISCVGHETDFTIADFAADMRAPTPSAAAELAVPVAADLRAGVAELTGRMRRALFSAVSLRRAHLMRLTSSAALSMPKKLIIEARRAQLDALKRQMDTAFTRTVQEKKSGLALTVRALGGVNPASVLARGYAVIEKAGVPVTSVENLRPGDAVGIRLSDGGRNARIE